MSWTTPDDVIASWIGDDVPTDADLIQRWIDRAERLLRREFPDLQDRIDSGDEPDLEATVIDVVAAMVTRVFRNQAGHRSVSGQETTGQFSGSNTITFGGENPGALGLLDEERDALRPPDAPRGGQAFGIGVLSASAVDHLPWCSLWFTGKWCSCGTDIAGRPIYEGA